MVEFFYFGFENCIVFGDGMNDVEMFLMVGKGLVMGIVYEKVFNVLLDNEVIGSNVDDVVVYYLY